MAHSRRLSLATLVVALTLAPLSPCSAEQGQAGASIDAPLPAPTGLHVVQVHPSAEDDRVASVTDNNFSQRVLDSQPPVLLFCVADWSAPAKRMDPVVAKTASLYADRLRVMKLDVDANPELRDRYVISGVPYYLLFKQGEVVGTKVGMLSPEQLRSWIDTGIQ